MIDTSSIYRKRGEREEKNGMGERKGCLRICRSREAVNDDAEEMEIRPCMQGPIVSS